MQKNEAARTKKRVILMTKTKDKMKWLETNLKTPVVPKTRSIRSSAILQQHFGYEDDQKLTVHFQTILYPQNIPLECLVNSVAAHLYRS